MGQWFIGKIPLDLKMIMLLDNEPPFNPPKRHGGLKSIFQYSIIPCAGLNLWSQNLPFI